MSEGKNNTRIAEELCVATGTVENHVTTIYQKLGLNCSRDEGYSPRVLAVRWNLLKL